VSDDEQVAGGAAAGLASEADRAVVGVAGSAKIETSCLAEYAEREIARLHNTTPPDERDDHSG
jgi:hypothetical protein